MAAVVAMTRVNHQIDQAAAPGDADGTPGVVVVEYVDETAEIRTGTGDGG